jgi:hypothetical protein
MEAHNSSIQRHRYWKWQGMSINQNKFEAGFIYALAKALQRRCPGHFAIDQAANWLRSHGYASEADKLVANSSACFHPFEDRHSLSKEIKSYGV